MTRPSHGASRLPAWRLYAAYALVFLGFLLLLAGGAWRLSSNAQTLKRESSELLFGKKTLLSHRGSIVDSNGAPLAVNVDEYVIYASREALRRNSRAFAVWDCHLARELEGCAARAGKTREWASAQLQRARQILRQMGAALELSPQELTNKLGRAGGVAPLHKKASPQMLARFQDLRAAHDDFPNAAFWRNERSQRFYLQGEWFAHVVGHIRADGGGVAGVEKLAEPLLAPRAGKTTFERNVRGRVLRLRNEVSPQNGKNLTLAFDSRLQYFAHEALAAAVNKHRAKAAAAVVMDAKTGALLALANYPSFNPNNIREQDVGARMRNVAVEHMVEPGSTVKPFVVAAALQAGRARAGEVLPTARPLRYGKLRVEDSHIDENLPLVDVVAKSSNVGAALLAERLGPKNLWELYNALGFGGNKLLGLPAEAAGGLRHYDDWRKSDFITHAYGYGLQTSLLKLARAYSVFAADGRLLAPRLFANQTPPPPRQVFSPAVARQVRAMLERAASPFGTAAAAAVPGYRVAGKTGTAFKVDSGGYNSKKRRVFFVGMAPASAPRYIVAVMVDEPRRNGDVGGVVAAPVFARLMRRALLLGGVAPDGEASRSVTQIAMLGGGAN